MNHITKLKSFAWIIAGSFEGALLSIAATLVFLFGSSLLFAVPYIGHIIEEWAKTSTLKSNYRLLIFAGLVGGVIGSLLSKRYLKSVQTWFNATLVWGIPTITVLWLFYDCASHVAVLRQMKIADCNTSRIVNAQFDTPKGRYFYLVVNAPANSQEPLSGKIRISDGLSALEFPMGSNQNQKQQLDFLHAQKHYDLEMTFDRLPPPSTSIVLHYRQMGKDSDR